MTAFVTGEARHLGTLLARPQVKGPHGAMQLFGKRNLFSACDYTGEEYHSGRTVAADYARSLNTDVDRTKIIAPQIRRITRPLVPIPSFHQQHILSAKQFTQHDLSDLFSLAREMQLQIERYGALDILKGKVLCTAFYEPSTRTSASFEAAMKRCGGEIVSNSADRSSSKKGETLSDTIRTLAHYGDAIVLRHPDVGSAQLAAEYSPVPIFNAGDGVGEHPTQALLDIYTICSELGTMNGRTVTLLGDLKNGRTVHSLVPLLSLYSVRLNFVAPPSLAMPPTIFSAARDAGIPVTITESLDDVLADTDVLYVTRVQKERFDLNEQEWLQARDRYTVDHAAVSRAKKNVVVLHSLPRVNEIDPELHLNLGRATYSHLTHYSLFVRMALLASVMS